MGNSVKGARHVVQGESDGAATSQNKDKQGTVSKNYKVSATKENSKVEVNSTQRQNNADHITDEATEGIPNIPSAIGNAIDNTNIPHTSDIAQKEVRTLDAAEPKSELNSRKEFNLKSGKDNLTIVSDPENFSESLKPDLETDFTDNKITKDSTNALLFDSRNARVKWNKTRALSEPNPKTRVSVTLEPALDILHEEMSDGKEDIKNDSFVNQLTDTVSTEFIPDDKDGEYEISSSLMRSTALDSRLFDSQSSIVTHTRVESADTYSENRLRLKQGLIDYYNSYRFTTPEFPLLPNDEPAEGRYWPPWMTVRRQIETEDDLELVGESKNIDEIDRDDYEIEENVNQFRHLFHYEGRDIRNIYIIGDSGAGKTAFCRHIIQKWCLQHQKKSENVDVGIDTVADKNGTFTKQRKGNTPYSSIKVERTVADKIQNLPRRILNKSNESKSDDKSVSSSNSSSFCDLDELDKFEFLFYIPLFFETSYNSIADLINAQFKHIFNTLRQGEDTKHAKSNSKNSSKVLNEMFYKESEKCLIVLDGLDEWNANTGLNKIQNQAKGLPEKDANKLYTIIYTSSLEKMTELAVETTDCDLEVTLNGIDKNTSYDLITATIDRLNKFYRRKKSPNDMMTEMRYWKRTNYLRLPFILQSLVCLWYHSGTVGNTLSDIFSRILELLFKRFNSAVTESSKIRMRSAENIALQLNVADKDVKLPRYYVELSNCQKNKELISVLGQIAWRTKMHSIKSFDSSFLEFQGLSRNDIKHLIKSGVLTQSKVPGFSEELHDKIVFFPDERIQDFLATTYIVVLCRNTAYENIGQIDMHTQNIKSVVEAHLDIFSSLEDIFQHSNLIVFLCGLLPPTVEEMTQKIKDVVSTDQRVLNFRNSLDIESEDDVVDEIQILISRCAHESLSVNSDNVKLHLEDINYRYVDSDHLKYLEENEVQSLLINVGDGSLTSQNASQFIHQARIFHKLRKLLVVDESSQLNLQDIDYIHILSEHSAPTLTVVSYIFNTRNRITYQRITQDLHRLLPKMPNLLELELKGIKYSHLEFCTLSWTLTKLCSLKRLRLSDISCDMDRCDSEAHKMSFSEFENLEYIDVDGKELSIVALNKQKLHTCILGNLPQGPEIQIFHSLQKARCLKYFTQKVRQRPPFISQTLIQTLNTWHALETLNLHGVNFGENNLILDKQMQNLTQVRLVKTRMSRVAWCNFVNCLERLSQEIHVVTRGIHVTPIEQDVTRDPLRRPIDAETRAVMLARETELHAALDYVRSNVNNFIVLLDLKNKFDFKRTTV